MINYDPLWKTMKERNITTYTLLKKYHFHKATIQRLRRNQPISARTIDDLCQILNCSVEQVLLILPDEGSLNPRLVQIPDDEK